MVSDERRSVLPSVEVGLPRSPACPFSQAPDLTLFSPPCRNYVGLQPTKPKTLTITSLRMRESRTDEPTRYCRRTHSALRQPLSDFPATMRCLSRRSLRTPRPPSSESRVSLPPSRRASVSPRHGPFRKQPAAGERRTLSPSTSRTHAICLVMTGSRRSALTSRARLSSTLTSLRPPSRASVVFHSDPLGEPQCRRATDRFDSHPLQENAVPSLGARPARMRSASP